MVGSLSMVIAAGNDGIEDHTHAPRDEQSQRLPTIFACES